MQNDESVDASQQAIRYYRLAGDSASGILELVEWTLILGPRPADEGLRILEELAFGRPANAADLPRAALLAMLGRIDDAWQLAEARSDHLREVGGWYGGQQYLAAIAMIEGDRQRACRHHAELLDSLPPGSEAVASTYRLILGRDLCHLERFDEAEPLLRQSDAFRSNPVEKALGRGVEALLLAARGELEEAEARARAGVATAETETDTVWLQGWGHEDLATVLERAGRIDEAREALERALAVWDRKRCLPYVVRLRQQIDSLGRAKL